MLTLSLIRHCFCEIQRVALIKQSCCVRFR